MLARKEDVFETALKNSRDISQNYYNDLILRKELADDPAAFEGLLASTRDRMQQNGGIRHISSVAASTIRNVEIAHNAGYIAAVDGTDAIKPTPVMSKTVYAVGVISVTARTLHRPRIIVTESHRQIPPISDDETFEDFVRRLDEWVHEDQSWMHAFREDCERKEALRLIEKEGVPLVLVDGPLYTENLLTRHSARHTVLDDMQRHFGKLIGFIKNLGSSKVMQFAGMALHPGEYWTVAAWRQIMRDRFKSYNSNSDWVRTIYRKSDKAFAFECHPSLVETGIALVSSSVACAAVINHEIPFLLHCADRIVQARVAAAAKSDNLINSLPYYSNLADERTFR